MLSIRVELTIKVSIKANEVFIGDVVLIKAEKEMPIRHKASRGNELLRVSYFIKLFFINNKH